MHKHGMIMPQLLSPGVVVVVQVDTYLFWKLTTMMVILVMVPHTCKVRMTSILALTDAYLLTIFVLQNLTSFNFVQIAVITPQQFTMHSTAKRLRAMPRQYKILVVVTSEHLLYPW